MHGKTEATGTSPRQKKARLVFEIDDRPSLTDLRMPGPRRAKEGRGGAQASLEVMRYVIRCPLLPALAGAIAKRDMSKGGRPALIPDVFWLFYAVISRERASAEAAREEILTNWVEIAKEFYYEHDVTLPVAAKFDHSGFTAWRNRVIGREGQLNALLKRFTAASAPLALAVREAYVPKHETDLLTPTRWDMLAGDGTVMNAPSDVRETTGPDGESIILGSRAKEPANARVHSSQRRSSKKYGAQEGLNYVAVSTQGNHSYTRTILGIDIGQVHEGEMTVAMRVLRRVLDSLGTQFPVLTYDSALAPAQFQDLMLRGILTINTNRSRVKKTTRRPGEAPFDTADSADTHTGQGLRRHGTQAGAPKATYVTPLNPVRCTHGGETHVHHLAADDGTTYETATPLKSGRSARRLKALTSERLDLMGTPGHHWFQLTVAGTCDRAPNATFTCTVDLTWKRPRRIKNKDGSYRLSLDARSFIANIRPVPDTDPRHDHARGNRNMAESFFAWLERRFYTKDRAQSYERPAQILDFLAAGLLNNAETWAHLAVRHPEATAPLAQTLSELPSLRPVDLRAAATLEETDSTLNDGQAELLTVEPVTKKLSLAPAAIAQPSALLTFPGNNADQKTRTAPCTPPPPLVSIWA